MRIVLPGALPDPREARELTEHLQASAPTLLGWLRQARARLIPADPAHSGCTPYELWQLLARGFQAEDEQNFATGLGPLWAQDVAEQDQPVWLVELVHVSPSRDGAALLPAAELAISAEDSVALFNSVQELFAEVGFHLSPSNTQHWRIRPPADYAPVCASPALVSITSVNDWWPQDMASRPWRRLVNEVQMLWYEHPVNQARYRQGLVPINSLWLFGGARANQLVHTPAGQGTQVYQDLQEYSIKHDWGGWLAALAQLEARVFAPLAGGKMPELILTGADRVVELTPATTLGRWAQWLPGSRNTWSHWWSPQN
ncbi:hypothetical protein [Pollutimonas harenae]|uniref:Phosphoglycerate mutase n=1 Tax=Pollutimonas harenae TaxID=657015 RepID=A0A853GVN2_9BURK|nr:hypothetical protein [Pollutimonas harenae]NYT86197.1 hypothetical protein [Pollutimonas harenae]TEA71230.1 hypothetical protein ERD84_11385 [Pollutimonas harenae]